MAFSEFQYAITSGSTTQRQKIQSNEDWVVDNEVKGIRIKESLESAVRICEVQINNPDGKNIGRYKPFQRVRLIDRRSNVILFLGRVDSIIPDHRKQHITLLCRDYMSELVEATMTTPRLSGNRRSDIVRKIIAGHDGKTWEAAKGVYQATDTSTAFTNQQRGIHQQHKSDKNVNWWSHVDESSNVEYITKNYGSGRNSGHQSFMDAIQNLASAEPWRDTQVLLYTDPSLTFENGNSEYLLTRSSGSGETGWLLCTAEMLGGTGRIPKPQFTVGTGTGATGLILYIGSHRQFRGLDIQCQKQTGAFDTFDMEYWTGSAWQNISNVTDGTTALTESGKVTWRSTSMSSWDTKTNLIGVGSTNTFVTYLLSGSVGKPRYRNSYNESQMNSYQSSSPINFDTTGSSFVDGGATAAQGWSSGQADDYGGNTEIDSLTNPPLSNMYWVRLTVRRVGSAGAVSGDPGSIFSISTLPTTLGGDSSTDPDDYLPAEAKWDFRMEDPFFFNSVGYTTSTGAALGNWTDRTVSATTKSSADNFSWFQSSSSGTFYIGADKPFGGIEFQLEPNSSGQYGLYGGTPRFQYSTYSTGSSISWTTVVDDNLYAFNQEGSVRFSVGAANTPQNSITSNWARVSLNDSTLSNASDNIAPVPAMYWIKVDTTGLSSITRSATIKLMRTISVGALAFFERGTEPWNYNVQGARDGAGPSTRLRDTSGGLSNNGGSFNASIMGQQITRISQPAEDDRNATIAAGPDEVQQNYLDLSDYIFPSASYTAKYNLEVAKHPGLKAGDMYGDSLHTAAWHGERSNWHGLTLTWRGSEKDWELPIYRYEIGESPADLMTRITVYGKQPSSGTAINKKREDTFGIKKQKTIYDRSLETNQECKLKAEAVLRTFEPASATTIRRGTIEVYNYPTYKFNAMTSDITGTTTGSYTAGSNYNIPRVVRAGDVVNVNITDGSFSLSNEKFLVWAIEYNDTNSLTKITVSQDLIPSFGQSLTAVQRAVHAEKLAIEAAQQNATPSPNSNKDLILSADDTKVDARARIHVTDQQEGLYAEDGFTASGNKPGQTSIKIQKFQLGGNPYGSEAEAGYVDYGSSSYTDAHAGNENYTDALAIHPAQGGAITMTGTSNDVTGIANTTSGANLIYDEETTFSRSDVGVSISRTSGSAPFYEGYITEFVNTNTVLTSGTITWASGDAFTLNYESDINTGTAGFYYNTTDDLFKAKVEAQAPLKKDTSDDDIAGVYAPQWHHIAVGEWGTVQTSGGQAIITLENTYTEKPVVLLTVDTSHPTSGATATTTQRCWAEVEMYQQSDGSAWGGTGQTPPVSSAKLQVQVYTGRVTLAASGCSDNISVSAGGTLYTSDVTANDVLLSRTMSIVYVNYMVMPTKR